MARSGGVSRRSWRRWVGAATVLSWSCAAASGESCPGACPLPPVGTLDAEGARWVAETMSDLTLRQRVAQLIIQWLPGGYASTTSEEFQEWARWVERDQIGGIYLSIGLPHSYAAKVNELQARATVPLLVTSDFENGGPGMRINHSYALPSLLPQGGGTSFPPTMAFGAIDDPRYAAEYGRITGLEARAVGVNLNFAPVLDVNSNPDNPVINTRSFGEDPERVARLGAAYLAGARQAGMLTTAKHFPGHGDTETDSHIGLPVVPADWRRLEALELVPFRRAVEEGVDAVMTAHVVVPGIQGPEGNPATLDPVFMTELLRGRMGFEGLLFTDALVMGAITDRFGSAEVSVLAIEAGADVLLMPSEVTAAIDVVVEAVEAGRISRQRIDASVRRVLEAKAKAGLHRQRFVDLDAVDDRVGTLRHRLFADSAAARSITLLKDDGDVLPIFPELSQSVVSITYARSDDLVAGNAFDPDISERVRSFRSIRLGPTSGAGAYDSAYVSATGADLVLLNAYVPPRSGVGDISVPEALADFVAEVGARVPLVVTSFGNPYLLATLPEAPTYLIAWGGREVSQRAAARALFGITAIGGRLPISIPPFHAIGDGLSRPELGPTSTVDPPPSAIGAEPEDSGPRGGPSSRRAVRRSPAEADPGAVGFDEAALEAVDRLIRDAIADSATPGAALAIGRRGRLARMRGYGRLDWARDARDVSPGSLYDLASLTKVVATTTAAMLLVEEGTLDLEAPVARYLPWWSAGDERKAEVTVRQLLLHRSGLPPFRRFFLDIEGREAFEQAIGKLTLDSAPGSTTTYSDIGLMTLAFVIEEVAGKGLDAFLESRVWSRLGMLDTGFVPDSRQLPRTAATEVDESYRKMHVRGVVHDENAYAIGGVAGHAGLFSSAWDLARFAQLLLSRGSLPACAERPSEPEVCVRGSSGLTLISPGTVDAFTRRWDETASRALGWDTPSGRSSAGDFFTENAFGHTGFTGTSIWIDPALDVFVVLLTNRVNPTRENGKHVPLRRAVHDAVANAIVDRPVARRTGPGSR